MSDKDEQVVVFDGESRDPFFSKISIEDRDAACWSEVQMINAYMVSEKLTPEDLEQRIGFTPERFDAPDIVSYLNEPWRWPYCGCKIRSSIRFVNKLGESLSSNVDGGIYLMHETMSPERGVHVVVTPVVDGAPMKVPSKKEVALKVHQASGTKITKIVRDITRIVRDDPDVVDLLRELRDQCQRAHEAAGYDVKIEHKIAE